MLTILKYSHHFALESPHENYVGAIESFTRYNLISVKYTKLWNGKVIKNVDKIFAVKYKRPLTYRFHINALQEFMDWMRTHGHNKFNIIEQEMYEPEPADFKIVTDKKPWGMQPDIISYLASPGSKKVIELQAGQGKGLLNGTPVRTINGWANIEDLKVGDRVMGETGEFHNVTGVYPQGMKDLYRITFRDGRIIITDESHLWVVSNESKRSADIISQNCVLNSEEIHDRLNNGEKFYIPVITRSENDSVEHELIHMRLMNWCNVLYNHVSIGHNQYLFYLKHRPEIIREIKELCYSLGALCYEKNDGYLVVIYRQLFCLQIDKVEKLPEQGETTCISVDNPTKLFVTKDYIVTHNTLCTLFAVNEIKQRTVLCIKPMYIQRWMDDLAGKNGIFKLKPNELCKVQGSSELASIIRMGLDDTLEYKFIIISNKTLHLYYKDFINGEDMAKYHHVKPFDLFKVLKAGVRVIDEAHQDFHQCFKTDLFSHVPKTIELSATLEPDDPFLKKMYETVYPREKRFGGGVYHKYVNVVAVPYRLDPDNNSRVVTTQRGMTAYSHGAFEESIMRDKKRLSNYLDKVQDLATLHWFNKRVDDYKLLIFASRVDMCRLIVERLQSVFNNLKITKYTEEEDYRILPEMDIIVSTPISAGTAVDIPKLQVCVNTVALGATQANLQMIGRLRELRGVDVKPTFVYTYCIDIPKHEEYHIKKKEHIFKGKVLEYLDWMCEYVV